MASTTLTFVRHAESVANTGAITMPHDTIPLSDLGRRQAKELSELLNVEPAAILVSNMTRTHQTATPFFERFSVLPEIRPNLNEFSVIDSDLIAGLNGAQRKPFVKSYWDDADPNKRLGTNADTFIEFEDRISAFLDEMETLPDSTLIFGHGIWFGLLFWRLLGFRANTPEGMRLFRRFQLGFPMPNCAVFSLERIGTNRWNVQANTEIATHIAAIPRLP